MKAKKPKVHRLRRNAAGKAVSILRKALAEAAEAECHNEFWWLVTGQRGPDDDSDAGWTAKDAGTLPVREACGPPKSSAFRRLFAPPVGWKPGKVCRNRWSRMSDHWKWHIENAVRVCHEAFGTTRSDEGGETAEDGK